MSILYLCLLECSIISSVLGDVLEVVHWVLQVGVVERVPGVPGRAGAGEVETQQQGQHPTHPTLLTWEHLG